MTNEEWPSLVLSDWEPTYKTLHRWLQIVGKIKLRLTPPTNHWWHGTLFLTPYGLTTLTMPRGEVEIALDFVEQQLTIRRADGRRAALALQPMSVADFYQRLLESLHRLGIDVDLWPVPVEVTERTPFTDDRRNCTYDGAQVRRVHRVLLSAERVFLQHRGRFLGKSSPVHFFWGAFDLAVTRFSGRVNPNPPADRVNGPAYSHEVISHGFWPGGDWPGAGRVDEAVFYAYAVPEPPGLRSAGIEPDRALYSDRLHEFVLPYAAVSGAADPDATLLRFMESTYRAAAAAASWPALECDDPLARPARATSGPQLPPESPDAHAP